MDMAFRFNGETEDEVWEWSGLVERVDILSRLVE